MTKFFILSPVLVLMCSGYTSSLTYCQKGTYEHLPQRGKEVCLLCPEGTFMPYYNHRYKKCFDCTEIVDPDLEIFIAPCNKTQDTVIHCIDGYYRRRSTNLSEKATCEKCGVCDFPIVPCSTYEDVHCCQADHFIVYPDKDGVPLCWETYWLCRRGHYLKLETYLCEPCPDGTFMSLDYHSMTKCWPCQTPSEIHHLPKHAFIVQPCNSTHPPTIGCQDGFYIDFSKNTGYEEIGCFPCKACNAADGMYVGRKCDSFHDTVCCREPDMAIVDTSDGPRCHSKPSRNADSKITDVLLGETSERPLAEHDSRKDSNVSYHNADLSYTSVIGIVVATVIAFIVIVTVTLVSLYRYRHPCLMEAIRFLHNSTRGVNQRRDSQEAEERSKLLGNINAGNRIGEPEPHAQEINNDEIEAHVERFKLSEKDYRRVMELLGTEMSKGLKRNSNREADIKMFPTFVRSLPDGSETGEFLALDLGGTKFRIFFISLQAGDMDIKWRKAHTVPPEVKSGNGEQLFDFIADHTREFISQHRLADSELPLGFTFSFSCQHEALDKARLVQWTKGFNCKGVEGKDICKLLQEALNKRGLSNVKIVAILNDAVSILVSATNADIPYGIGLDLGDGCNASYMERLNNVETWDDHDESNLQPRQMIINTEWGALGDNGCLDFIRTDYDRIVDEQSVNPNYQRLEKMISGLYLGEIVRLVLEKLYKDRLLFKHVEHDCFLLKKNGFSTKFVSQIESDSHGAFQNTRRVLDDLQIEDYTAEDCKIVKYICALISERAAFLAAAALATLINHMNKPDIAIAVDGSLYKFHPRIHNLMKQKIEELIRSGLKFSLHEAEGGSAIGAALAAAMALRARNTASQEASFY